jgi:hypothetical protein
MSFLKAIGISILIYIICIVVVDIGAVLIAFFLPEPGGRRLSGGAGFGSTALYYVLWAVAGCFGGVFYIATSLDKTQSCKLVQQYPVTVPGIALVLSAILIVVFYAVGEMNTYSYASSDFYYVPGHRYMTYTFFVSLVLTSFFLSYKEGKTAPGESKI